MYPRLGHGKFSSWCSLRQQIAQESRSAAEFCWPASALRLQAEPLGEKMSGYRGPWGNRPATLACRLGHFFGPDADHGIGPLRMCESCFEMRRDLNHNGQCRICVSWLDRAPH